MSIIQTIRDKGARIAVILIALSLIGFILMDAFTGRSNLFRGGNSTVLGKVNGTKIDQREFAEKIQNEEKNRQLNEEERQQLIQNLWDQEVNNTLLKQEFEKLGLGVSATELNDMLYGPEPSQYAKQFFYNDPNSTQYDPNQVAQSIAQVKRTKNAEQLQQLNRFLDALQLLRAIEKYNNLVAGSIHYPKWLLEKQNVDNSLLAKVSYINIPYSVIPDSSKEVAVTDDEIKDYINKHKDQDQFKNDQETRTVEYVAFSAKPSPADSAATLNQLQTLKPSFETTDTANTQTFLTRNGSVIPFFDGYVGKSQMQVVAKDSIYNLKQGQVYGPYLDGGNFVLAKLLEVKVLPDSVYCRHILLKTTGEGALPDSVASKKMDSIISVLNAGADFVKVMKAESMDAAANNSPDSMGTMKFSAQDIQNKEQFDQDFGRFILFDGKTGDRKKIKTQFGYHYIWIVDQKNIEVSYKVAYMAKRIDASDETDNNAENNAMQLAGNTKDIKSFEEYYDKNLRPKGYQKFFSLPIASHDYKIQGLGVSRDFVKKVFEADKGDVMQPERVEDNYVVAVVSEINEKGLKSVTNARPIVEPVIRNRKKAEIIKKKLGPITTLESAAHLASQQFNIKDSVLTADSVKFAQTDNRPSPLSFEKLVVGAAFNPSNKGKVVNELLESVYGSCYVLRVDNVSAIPVENADINAQRQSLERQGRFSILMSSQFASFGGQQYDPAAVLKKGATIKDYRDKYY